MNTEEIKLDDLSEHQYEYDLDEDSQDNEISDAPRSGQHFYGDGMNQQEEAEEGELAPDNIDMNF
jgi:hypothetical protein